MTVRLSRLCAGGDVVPLPEEVRRRGGGVGDTRERLVVEPGEGAGAPETVVARIPRADVEVRQLVTRVARRGAVVGATRLRPEVGAEVEVLRPELNRRRRLGGVRGGPRAEQVGTEGEPLGQCRRRARV